MRYNILYNEFSNLKWQGNGREEKPKKMLTGE